MTQIGPSSGSDLSSLNLDFSAWPNLDMGRWFSQPTSQISWLFSKKEKRKSNILKFGLLVVKISDTYWACTLLGFGTKKGILFYHLLHLHLICYRATVYSYKQDLFLWLLLLPPNSPCSHHCQVQSLAISIHLLFSSMATMQSNRASLASIHQPLSSQSNQI